MEIPGNSEANAFQNDNVGTFPTVTILRGKVDLFGDNAIPDIL